VNAGQGKRRESCRFQALQLDAVGTDMGKVILRLLHQPAFGAAAENLSEATRRLPSSLRDRHPELPWRAIMGVGNVYRHDYDNVAEQFVWHTVQHSLEPLLAVVESEIARLLEKPS
jgi:uncharacterized protein with HEPN domain